MADISPQKLAFMGLTIAGISLLVVHSLISGSTMGFFLMLFMVCMALFRSRVPKTGWTSVVDMLACVFFAPMFLGVALFATMYYGMYFTIVFAFIVLITIDIQLGIIAILCGGLGLLLRLWEHEQEKRLKTRDAEAGRYYQLKALQNDLLSATEQIERMSIISERARISREIHDNAGHEIVAAYISLQTVRDILDSTDPETLALYDAALERLGMGVNKVREAVHNLAPVSALGVEALQEICNRFPKDIEFKSFGDMRLVPVHVWNVLESCLNECLTNIGKHANPSKITVELDATPHIVRLCIENDGVTHTGKGIGTGLRNLRHRLNTIGGTLAVTQGEIYRVVCMVPIKKLQINTP
ncbi:MAG: histidine kinase [Firmicutes bacterium]|nr:histidine kinase [Bacillota bacterium]